MKELFLAVWFFLPAGLANMIPIIVAKLPGLRAYNAPIDGGKTYRGKRVFGAHKTWRGLLSGIVMATLVLWLQQVAIRHSAVLHDWTSQVDYLALNIWIVGPLFGIGALGGDAIESFFKRQRGVAPGHGWFPFDQTDYIIGGALLTAPFIRLDFFQYVALLVIWLIVHIVASYIGFLLHFKERPI
jgi:CDP-2,3-bis-(O-geranylgeranyl)-sn-glycerol synthase